MFLYKKFLPVLIITMMLSGFSAGQDIPAPALVGKQFPLETVDDAYLPNAHGNQKTSEPYLGKAVSLRGTSVFTTQVNVNDAGENILDDAANEPSIAVSPVDKNHLVIGWRQFDNVNSNFRQAGWSYSADGGQTWTFPGVLEPGMFRSDPVLDFDKDGNFYYNSLSVPGSYDFECHVFRSFDGGATWDGGTHAQGGDKQWMTIDRTNGVGSGNIYSFWTGAFSSCPPGFFTRSTDGGDSYENCIAVDGDPYWGTMAIGKGGELFIVGGGEFGNLVVVRSDDAQMPGTGVSWSSATEVDVDGYLDAGVDVNPAGLLGQANIDADVSDGPWQGNVYVLAPVHRFSVVDPGDVMFSRSTDGGATWETPIRINDDVSTANSQWFGTMSVAPNGRIDVVWLDTRDGPVNSDFSALYYSYSLDGGASWSVNEKLSDLFDPHVGYPNQSKLGDYFDMTSDSAGAFLAWANTFNGEQDVYFSRIEPALATSTNEPAGIGFEVYPNPTSGAIEVVIPFVAGVFQEGTHIEISNVLGTKLLSYPVTGSRMQVNLLQQPPGIYFVKVSDVNGTTMVQRIVKR